MADNTAQDIASRRVLYTLPGMDRAKVRGGVEYRGADGRPLTMDLYYPGDSHDGAPRPAVLFVTGFPDPGARRVLGRAAKEMGSYVSWAQLVAASGLVAITYANNTPADAFAVLDDLRQNAAPLGIDAGRIGVWSCSGSGPMGLSMLMHDGAHPPRCGALLYPYTLDLGDATAVSAAAQQWGFVNACAGKSLQDFPPNRALFVARAGHDQMPGLNEALDRFASAALARNLPITIVNHATGPHAFDLFDDSVASHHVVRQTLAFLRFELQRTEQL